MDAEHQAHLDRILANRRRRGASVPRGASASTSPARRSGSVGAGTQTTAERVSTATLTMPETHSIGIGTTPTLTASAPRSATQFPPAGPSTSSGGRGPAGSSTTTTTTTTTNIFASTAVYSNSNNGGVSGSRGAGGEDLYSIPTSASPAPSATSGGGMAAEETWGGRAAANAPSPQHSSGGGRQSVSAQRSQFTNRIMSPDFSGAGGGAGSGGGGSGPSPSGGINITNNVNTNAFAASSSSAAHPPSHQLPQSSALNSFVSPYTNTTAAPYAFNTSSAHASDSGGGGGAATPAAYSRTVSGAPMPPLSAPPPPSAPPPTFSLIDTAVRQTQQQQSERGASQQSQQSAAAPWQRAGSTGSIIIRSGGQQAPPPPPPPPQSTPPRTSLMVGGGGNLQHHNHMVMSPPHHHHHHQSLQVRDARGVPIGAFSPHQRHWSAGRSRSAEPASSSSPARHHHNQQHQHQQQQQYPPDSSNGGYSAGRARSHSAGAVGGGYSVGGGVPSTTNDAADLLFARGVFDNFRRHPILISGNIRPYRKGESNANTSTATLPPLGPPPLSGHATPSRLSQTPPPSDWAGGALVPTAFGDNYAAAGGDEDPMLVGVAGQWGAVGGGIQQQQQRSASVSGTTGTALIAAAAAAASNNKGQGIAAPQPLPPAMAASLMASKAVLGPLANAAANTNPTVTNLMLPQTDPNPFRVQRFEDFVIDPNYAAPDGSSGPAGSVGVSPAELIRRFREGDSGHNKKGGGPIAHGYAGVVGAGGGNNRASPLRARGDGWGSRRASSVGAAAAAAASSRDSSGSPIRFRDAGGVGPNPNPTEMNGAAPQISALVQSTANAPAPLYNFGAALRALESGDWFLKWSRRGEVSKRYFTVDSFNGRLHWCHHKESINIFTKSSMRLADVISFKPVAIIDEADTDAGGVGGYEGGEAGNAATRTIYKIEITTRKRFLHIGTEIKDKFDVWYDTLRRVIDEQHRGGPGGVGGEGAAEAAALLQGQRVSTTKPSDRAMLRQMNTREFFGAGDE